MVEPLRVGLVGCGGMGKALVGSVAESGVGRPCAFCDVVVERRDALAEQYEGRAFESLEALLADEGLDAVVVATLPSMHEEHAIAALRAGRHVLVEKPMALSVAGCERMIEAAREAGVTLMVGQVLRYIEPWHSILRWNREGRFGRPFHACMQRIGSGGVFSAGTWRSSAATCGGYLFEISAHELDFMRCLMGRPAEVYAVRQKVRKTNHDIEDVISLLVRFESGATAHYDGGTAWGRGKNEFYLCFENATLVNTKGSDPSQLVAIAAEGEREIPLEGFATQSGVTRQVRGWLEALRDGTKVPVPGEEGRETVRLAESAYRSAAEGRPVAIEPLKRKPPPPA